MSETGSRKGDTPVEYPSRLNMPVGEAMFSQRAIRRLAQDPISDEELKIILDAASKAPNGGNRQPGRFLVIRSRDKIAEFGKLYHEAWWAKRYDEYGWTGPEDVPPDNKVYASAMVLADEMSKAPVIVLVFAIKKGLANSIFPSVQNLLLSARALGIGSTLTTLHPKVMERVNAMFNIPEEAEFHCCLPLGRPRGRFGPTSRLPTSETTFFDGWDQSPPWA